MNRRTGEPIMLRDLRVSDAILYLLLKSDVIGTAIPDAKLLAAVQELYGQSSGLLHYRMRGYSNGGVDACAKRILATWFMEGLMPVLIEEVEAGLVIKRRATSDDRLQFCAHVAGYLDQYLPRVREVLVDQSRPASNPAGVFVG